ncbi:MAG: caspase family protein [Cyanobacteria bacterium P01_D01_bin.156]
MSRDALIVGINQYQYLSPLTTAAKDGEAMASQLETHGNFRVRRLPEAIKNHRAEVGQQTHVSRQQLESNLVNLLLPKGDHVPETAFFYFSGHGLQREVGIREGFLAASDTQPDTFNNGLSLSWLRRLIRHSPVRQIIIILDCCHSGEFLALKDDAWQGNEGQSYLFIAASRSYEEAYESLQGDYSVLTQAILSGLSPHQSNSGRVTSTELVASITNQLSNEIQQPLFEQGGTEIIITQHTEMPVIQTDNISVISRLKQYSLNYCPYRGFQPFEKKHADYYFGREPVIQELLQKLRHNHACALIGASGSGKTSLLRAGIMSRLAAGNDIPESRDWIVRYTSPASQPLKNLAAAFTVTDQTIAIANQLSQAEELLRSEPNGLMHLVNAALLQQPGATKFWLIIDQFEDLLTPTGDRHIQQECQQVIELLVNALANPATSLGLIIGLRADAIDGLLPYKTLFSLVESSQVVLTPMNYQEIRDVIEKPAEKLGLKLDPHLVHHLTLDLTGAPGELALLQSVLQDLWRQRTSVSLSQGAPCLSLKSYMKLGRLSKILVDRATDLYDSLPTDEKTVAQRIFLTLCELGEGRLDQSRRARKCELVNPNFPEDIIERVLNKLVTARLIVTNKMLASPSPGENGRTIPTAAWETRASETAEVKRWLVAKWPVAQTTSDETIELAHNSLISDWSLLRQWLQANRFMIRQRRDIEERAWLWHSRGEPKCSDYLLGHLYLKNSHGFLKSHLSDLSELGQRFVYASRRTNTFQLWKARSVAVLLPLAMIAGMTVSLARHPRQSTPKESRSSLGTLLPNTWGIDGVKRLTLTSQILNVHRQVELSELSITQLAELMALGRMESKSSQFSEQHRDSNEQ